MNINNLLVNEEKQKADPVWFCCDSAVEELLAGTLRADVFTALGWQPQHLLWLQLGWWSLIHPSWSLSVPQARTSAGGFLGSAGGAVSVVMGSRTCSFWVVSVAHSAGSLSGKEKTLVCWSYGSLWS